MVARPLEQVVEEVDHAGVGPLQVLDDHDDGQVLGEALEEKAPAREELLSREHLGVGRPSSWPRRGAMNSRSAASGIQRSRPAAQPLGDDLLRVLLADLEPCRAPSPRAPSS